MASVHRRKGRNGKPLPNWYYKFKLSTGAWHEDVGTTNKAETMEIARRLEAEQTLIRKGLAQPGETRARDAALIPMEQHLEDYRDELLSKGDTEKHVKHTIGVLRRLLESAEIKTLPALQASRLQMSLGRIKEKRSARTANHARQSVLTFLTWLDDSDRIMRKPSGLKRIKPFNVQSDRKRVRRSLTFADVILLLRTAEESHPVRHVPAGTKVGRGYAKKAYTASVEHLNQLPGSSRAMLYRLAMGTGFRANELRSLTPECFRLDGDEPCITVQAKDTKNKKDAVQPITRELADQIGPFLTLCEPGKPVLNVPIRTATMLHRDLKAAGIPIMDDRGRVVDFHALRKTYITHLIMSGANPKIVQTLARHSTITLTLDVYTDVQDSDVRRVINKLEEK